MNLPATLKLHSFAILLLIGVLIRVTALNQPLIDSGLLRQCQTAAATREMIREPGLQLSTSLPWRGDSEARLVQELPTYNYMVIAVNAVIGNLDMSGKIITVLLWAVSFLLLQLIWRRVLLPEEIPWANVLFVFSPLSNFFGQAFMPEMVVQALVFGFIAALLRYSETRRIGDFLIVAVVGALAILQKAPATSHLYLIAGAVIFTMRGWKLILRPEYWVALIATALLAKAWGGYMDSVNAAGAMELTASKSLSGFMGTLDERLNLHFYRRIAGYIIIFLITPGCFLFVLGGLVRLLREKRHILIWAWLGSLVFFYLVWGPRTAGEHTYYNLPALGPACILFAMGVCAFQKWLACVVTSVAVRRAIGVAVVLVTAAAPVAVTLYLYRQDRLIYTAAHWIRDHTEPQDLIVFVGGHRTDFVNFQHIATMPYYAERKVWIWCDAIGAENRNRARETSQWAVTTEPPEKLSALEAWRRRVKDEAIRAHLDTSWLAESGFKPVFRGDGFTIYRKQTPAG